MDAPCCDDWYRSQGLRIIGELGRDAELVVQVIVGPGPAWFAVRHGCTWLETDDDCGDDAPIIGLLATPAGITPSSTSRLRVDGTEHAIASAVAVEWTPEGSTLIWYVEAVRG